MPILPPIPKDPIKESFVWREWFQRLSDRVFGSASTVNVPISIPNGGTGQTTANSGLNALLPTQTGNNGKVLGTDGSNTSWVTGGGGGGATGPQGPMGFGMDGMDGEDGTGIPGPQGAPATPGNAAYGEMNIIANASGTVCTLQNTFYQITTNWAAGNNNGFTYSSSSLTAKYPGAYLTSVSLSMSSTSSNQIYEVRIYKNGAAIAGHVAELKLINSTDVDSLAFTAVVDNVQANDVFTLWLQNESSAAQTATISYANVSITAIQGATGLTGPQGMPGLDGEQGEEGPHGPPGNLGPTGATGSQGPTGPAVYLEAPEADEPVVFPGPAGAAGSTGAQGPSGPAVYLEVEPLEPDMFVVPGPQGIQGTSGSVGVQGPSGPAVFLEAEPGEDGAMGSPGVAGAAGVAGSTGSQGPSGPAIFLDAEVIEPDVFIVPGSPGTQGVTGNTGSQGPVGPAVFLEADIIEPDLFVVPGPQGTSINKGVATVNFGAFPGGSDATVAITGQTNIVAGSSVIAVITPVATADHSADEHWTESIEVQAGNIVPGTGFSIYMFNTNSLFEPGIISAKGTRIYGQWSVAWHWA